ncbi:MAG: rod shape-determining protein RodA [Pseudomonadota bacterium]
MSDFLRQLPGGGATGTRWARLLHIDRPLMTMLALFCLISLLVLYSASGQNFDTVLRQAVRMLLGFIVMLVLANISPRTLRFWAPWIYGFGMLLLLAVMLFGEISKGAQRWLHVPGFGRFQPSELMKLALPLMLAWYFHERPLPPRLSHLAVALLIVLIPALIIAEQPDLGTALLVATAGLLVVFFAGLSWRLIGGAVLVLIPVAWALFEYVLHDYQRQRVLTFLDPEADKLGAGWNVIQSTAAIGSGGFTGKGWLNGTQSHLEFLPESSTDFIVAVLGEETGTLGILLLLAAYAAIIGRCLWISLQAQDSFSRLLSAALAVTFAVYVVVNVGMVSGLLPVVGVPLPLVSYGGTSIVTLMAAFGIIMSLHTHRKLAGFGR